MLVDIDQIIIIHVILLQLIQLGILQIIIIYGDEVEIQWLVYENEQKKIVNDLALNDIISHLLMNGDCYMIYGRAQYQNQ